MQLQSKLQKLWKESPTQSPVARFFGMLISGALGISILGLWISAVSVYIDPRLFKWVALLGLAFPVFLFGTLFFWVIGLLFVPRKTWLLGLVGLGVCAQRIYTYCPIHPFLDNTTTSVYPHQLKVVSYNSYFFGRGLNQQDELMRYLIDQHADIICFQEGEAEPSNLKKIENRFAQTPTHYLSYEGTQEEVVGIISAYPVLEQKLIVAYPGNAIYAYRLQHPRGELIVVNCHFRSNLLSGPTLDGYTDMMHGRSTEDKRSQWNNTKTLFAKIAHSATERSEMVDAVEDYLAKHKDKPVILCGDFNDTPISYTRYRVAGLGLTDAFREGGQGFGFTFRRNAIRVRIDHIFCSKDFEPIQAKVDEESPYSDHQPISATFVWKDNKDNQ